MIYRILIALMMLTGAASATTHTISSLPYTAATHSGDDWDTLIIHADSGSVLHSQNHGIIFNGGNNDKWVINLSGDDETAGTADDDTIIFGIDTSWDEPSNNLYNSVGILPTGYYENPGADSMKILGGFILHRPEGVTSTSDYAVIDNTSRLGKNYCYYARWGSGGNNNIHFDGVTMEILGFQTGATDRGLFCIWSYAFTNLLIENCRLFSYVYGWDNRTAFTTGVIKMEDPSAEAVDEDEYNLKIVDSYLYSQAQNGIVLFGDEGMAITDEYIKFQMEGCSLVVDQRSTYSTLRYTNGYALMAKSIGPGSYIRDNVFLSGNNYNGGRGIEAREWNTVSATSDSFPSYTDTIPVYDNYFDMHQGYDDEYGAGVWSAMCLKIRNGSHYSHFYDNVFVLTADSVTGPGQGYSQMGVPVAIQLEMDGGSGSDRSPYHITFEDNLCSLKVISTDAAYAGYALSMLSNDDTDPRDTTIRVDNNYLYSEGSGVLSFGGGWDAMGKEFTLTGDTLDLSNAKITPHGTVNLGHWLGTWGHVLRDFTYMNEAGADSADIFHRTSTYNITNNESYRDWTLWNERTLQIYAMGNNDYPVPDAACSVWNDYGILVFTDTTNYTGLATDYARFFYFDRQGADSTGYNDHVVHIHKDADFIYDSAFTISNTLALDTLVLASTAGFPMVGSFLDTNDVDLTVRATYSGFSGVDTVWFFLDTDGTIASADSGGITADVVTPTDSVITGLSEGTDYDFWIVISHDAGRDTSAMFEVTTLNTVAHSVSVTDTGTTTIDVTNDYTANTVDTIWLWFDLDNSIVGADSVMETTSIADPDVIQATGLTENTLYYFWWGLHDQLGRDTASVVSVTTATSSSTGMVIINDEVTVSGSVTITAGLSEEEQGEGDPPK